jgi:antitoxin YefM
MKSVALSTAKNKLDTLFEQVAEGEPVCIRGRAKSAVLVSESDWRSIQETLYLLSVPGMRESIIEGMRTPLDECSEEPGW